jgi:hypothetical protein
MPTLGLRVHARLAPVAGTTAAGRFNGLLARSGEGPAPQVVPRVPLPWRLTWTLRLPALHRPTTGSLRIAAEGGAPPVVRVLCPRCATRANGTIRLTASQALRIAGSDAVVVVRARSATLRGAIKVTRVPVAMPG